MRFFGRNFEVSQNRHMWQLFCTMQLKWYFFENVFQHYIWGLLAEIRKNLEVEKRENMMKKQYFKKTLLSF